MQLKTDMAVAVCAGALLFAGCDPDEIPKFVTGPETIVVEGVTNFVVSGATFDHAGTNGAAAVVVRNSKNVRFEGCSFRHIGGWGIEFGQGAVSCAAVGCEFSDLGAGAVRIGCASDEADGEAGSPTGCVVEGCRIERGGLEDHDGAGLLVGRASGCRLSRNTMRDMRCSGIVCGWTRERGPSGAGRNVIEANDVSGIFRDGAADAYGICTFGEQPGTVVVGNSVCGVDSSRGSFGLCLGEGSAFVRAVSNYVASCGSALFFVQCNTASNLVAGNVFARGREAMFGHSGEVDRPTSPTDMRDNVFWWDDPNVVLQRRGEWNDDYLYSESNLYCVAGSPVAPVLEGFCRVDMPEPRPPNAEALAAIPPVPVKRQEPSAGLSGASLSNAFVEVAFDGKGCVSSMREIATGRELVERKVPFVSMRLSDGTEVAPESLCGDGGRLLAFSFPDGRGECRMEVVPFDGGWTFKTVKVSAADAAALVLGRIVPSCGKTRGAMSNVVMDGASAVAMRSYQCELEMGADETGVFVTATRELGFVDRSFGLAAGPADGIAGMLKRMSEAANMAKTGCGGPWSGESDASRGSRLSVPWPDAQTIDDWLRLAERTGCQTLCFDSWWKTNGCCVVNSRCFRDDDEMKDVVERIHECGRKAGVRICPRAVGAVDAPGSQLAEAATDRIAELYNGCAFDGIHFDVAEWAGTRYGEDWIRERTIEKLARRLGTIVVTTSGSTPFGWWHRASSESAGPSDFLRGEVLWPGVLSPAGRPLFPEDASRFGCAAAANERTTVVAGINLADGPMAFSTERGLTVFGWWERARQARAFKPGLLDRIRLKGDGFRLSQADGGEWRVVPFAKYSHRVESRESAKWAVDCAEDAIVELRVAADAPDAASRDRTVVGKGATVAVGSDVFAIPFDVPGGGYVELVDGFWTRYAESGEPVERLAATNGALRVAKGRNELSFDGTAGGEFARAEVTLVSAGEGESAFAPLTAGQKRLLEVEYEMPRVLLPRNGLPGKFQVRVRPEEKAKLCFEILGPAKYPVVAGRRIPIVLKTPFDRVGCHDGENWQAYRIHPGAVADGCRLEAAYRESLGEGTFSRPFETLGPGTAEIEVSDDFGAGARVTLFKKYVVDSAD